MSTCFIVYPLPSIADEGFLRAVFQDKVSRSLFAGFGPRRFAIAELSDADFARRVAEVLQAPHAVCTEAAADATGNNIKEEATTTITTESKKAKSTRTSAKKPRSAAKVQDWLNTIPAEEMTLATLFAPPIEESARLRPILAAPNNNHQEEQQQQDTSKDDEAAHTSEVNDSLASLSYLHTLLWRGQPVRIVCSPVTVDEFYRSGGVVPEKQSKSAKQMNNKDTREHKSMNAHVQKNKKRDHGEATPHDDSANIKLPEKEKEHNGMAARKRSRTEGAANTHHTPRDFIKSSPATQADAGHATRPTFPKDCCQKCGSKAHFTRHCDNSGLAGHEAAKKEVKDEKIAVKQEKLAKPERVVAAAVVAPVKTAPKTVVRTSKDQCKYCGSNDHLSRHCPNK